MRAGSMENYFIRLKMGAGIPEYFKDRRIEDCIRIRIRELILFPLCNSTNDRVAGVAPFVFGLGENGK